MNPKLQRVLDAIKDYNRPVRCLVWVVCIVFAFIGYVTGLCKEQINNSETMAIILGMFTDMGVYGISKSFEAMANIKANANATTNTNLTITKTTPDDTGIPNPETNPSTQEGSQSGN